MTATAKKLTLFALAWPIFVEQGLHVLVGTRGSPAVRGACRLGP